jgi:hypothetical protein
VRCERPGRELVIVRPWFDINNDSRVEIGQAAGKRANLFKPVREREGREREREGSENMAEEKVKAKSHWKFGTQFIVGGGSNYFDIRFLGFALSPLR